MAKKKIVEEAGERSLMDQLRKNSTVPEAAPIQESNIFDKSQEIITSVPMLNVALSGTLSGGMKSGLLTIAGKSKHFKTLFALLIAKSFLAQNPDGILIFYDSEFGTPKAYFTSLNIPMERVLHVPIPNIEVLIHDITNQFEGMKRGQKVMVVVDSIGNLASKKEVTDAIEGNDKTDMTRAKRLTSLCRIITPYLTIKDVPMVIINHIYMTQEMFSKQVMSGGEKLYLSSDNIWFIGRQQDAEGDGAAKKIIGYDFIINIEKSRHVHEKSKIPISVSKTNGIVRWSGLFEVAKEAGLIAEVKKGVWTKINSDGEVLGDAFKTKELKNNKDFWMDMITTTELPAFIQNKYRMSMDDLISDDEVVTDEGYDEE